MKSEPIHALANAGNIEIRGARQNNLKGIDLDVPLGMLNVICGPSGSGKSSLAFDTIYAEGQRRYVETFSPYTRQFLERMDKPKVDVIRGIPPAIAIEQSNPVKTTRSTVGTMTEINDYLKVLMPRIAAAFCPACGKQVRPESASSITADIMSSSAGETVLVTFGVPAPPGTEAATFFQFLQQQGYLRVWIEDALHRTDEPPRIKRLPGLVRVVQDRVLLREENRARLSDAVEIALRYGKGQISFVRESDPRDCPYSAGWHCAHCDQQITAPTPGLFSFNSPLGACPKCRGFGRSIGIDLERAVPDRSLSLAQGAVKPFQSESGKQCQRDLLRYAAQNEIDVRLPFEELPARDQKLVLYGERPGNDAEEAWENGGWYGVKGFFDWLEKKTYKMHVRVFLSRYRSYTVCPECEGTRFQPATLNFKVRSNDARWRTLPELQGLAISALAKVIQEQRGVSDSSTEMLRSEVAARLRYLIDVGVGYLSLDRPARTLSGGEIERVNLTTCLGTSLVNTLFVLDEPTIGLHPRDVGRLVGVMEDLRDKGNTLLVVEHEEAVLRAADNVIDIGPGRGEGGGELVYNGPLPGLMRERRSLTGDYLAGRKSLPVPLHRAVPTAWIKVQGASEHNLRRIDVDLPLGVFACVTGVSGSGKSTLVHEVLYRHLLLQKGIAGDEAAGACKRVIGGHRIDGVVMVDQSPLARTPRSSPALYLGVFDHIRELFALLPEAVQQGLSASSFSFNSGNGRCERCCGSGFEKIEMQFLSDIFVRCPECDGKRYQTHLLQIRLANRSIHDVLTLTITEAVSFFRGLDAPRISEPLAVLAEVGLGYLRLGQPLNVLSGGESQRLKLVSHLVDSKHKNNLLIFDEPTTGLHFDDVALLMKVFQRLVAQGNSLLVIEHNLEVIKSADYLVDLGPDAGTEGGRVVAVGTPEQVAQVAASHTGRHLRRMLAPEPKPAATAVDEPLARAAEKPGRYANEHISVHGAREHNLKNISLRIPRDQMVIITGLSGSGKSTLAFDILFAEGQRRFLDSMSPYARQFVQQLEKPDVDLITGLPPTVAIEQRITRGGGKSTVATVTEVYHFLRLLFAKLGTQYCPKCEVPVAQQTLAAITRKTEALAQSRAIRIFAPLVKARKGFHTDIARWAMNHGFETLLVDGKLVPVAAFQKLERFKEHTIDVLVGERGSEKRVGDLLRRALEIGRGTVRILDPKGRSTIMSTEMSCPQCGDSFEELDPRLFSFNSPHGWCGDCHGFGEVWPGLDSPPENFDLEHELDEEKQHEWLDAADAQPCPSCAGSRLNPTARNVRLSGLTISALTSLPAGAARQQIERLRFPAAQKPIADDVVPEIRQRLAFMESVGLSYLSLARSAKTLSGGESQRIRLAAQLGSNLRGVLYVLDEPTIGLHPRDNERLLETLEALKNKGNSLVVVEHDEETMRRADTIIDLGPCAGRRGGEVVGIGTLADIQRNEQSATGRCLNKGLCHPTKPLRRSLAEGRRWIEIRGARANNLRGIDVRIPVGCLTVFTGVSGSGKSTLMGSVLLPAMQAALARKKKASGSDDLGLGRAWQSLQGSEWIETVYEVDQAPIGKTSRSTPATYIKVFDEIRKQFALLPLARIRGYSASRFSFNAEGGRCETCAGQGVIKVEMNFLPASYIPCGDCAGQRYNAQTLEVLYHEKSIGDIMAMTMEEAAAFFAASPKIRRPLALLVETGLGYIQLGQPSPTLSGGEAQRLKLVTELTRGVSRSENSRIRKQREPKSTLYLLEEPTIGLHMADVEDLLKVLHRLVDEGNTVVVIEHNLSVIADADYLIDIGPEAGEGGGTVVVSGPPEVVVNSRDSRTAPFLKKVLGASAQGREPRSGRAARKPRASAAKNERLINSRRQS